MYNAAQTEFGNSTTYELLESIIGTEAANRLCEVYGGRHVYVPAHPREGHWLTDELDWETAQRLCDYFRAGDSGLEILLPKGRHPEVNRRLALEMVDAGKSVAEIASALNLHVRTVFRIVRHRAKLLVRTHGREIASLQKRGLRPSAIARRLAVSERAVMGVLRILKSRGEL